MSDRDDLAAVAAVLHPLTCRGHSVGAWVVCTCRAVAATLLPLIREREAAAWERALRPVLALANEDDAFGDLVGEIAAALRGGPAAYIDAEVVRIERCYASGNAQRVTRLVQDRLRASANPYTGSEGK